MRDRHTWRHLGEAARLAHEAVTRAFRAGLRDRDPASYQALIDDFRARTASALPSCQEGFMAGLAAGQPRRIDEAIAFLEADAWFFRSGYEKQALIRHLKRATLSAEQRRRLGGVVLAAIDGRDRVEFRHYCRLACGVWTEVLDDQVAERMASRDPGVRRRAFWVGEAAVNAGKA